MMMRHWVGLCRGGEWTVPVAAAVAVFAFLSTLSFNAVSRENQLMFLGRRLTAVFFLKCGCYLVSLTVLSWSPRSSDPGWGGPQLHVSPHVMEDPPG